MSGSANLHASAVALGGRGILIRGPAQSGKSALALALLRRGPALSIAAELIADDRVIAEVAADSVRLTAPETLKGLIEISGVGIHHEPARDSADLWFVADLVEPQTIVRLPPPQTADIVGESFPLLRLPWRESARCADILLSIALAGRLPG